MFNDGIVIRVGLTLYNVHCTYIYLHSSLNIYEKSYCLLLLYRVRVARVWQNIMYASYKWVQPRNGLVMFTFINKMHADSRRAKDLNFQ